MKNNIICLGTSHTYGIQGWNHSDYDFFDTYPGQLQTYLSNNGKNYKVINGGECGHGVQFYLPKLINFVKEYDPCYIIIEPNVNTKIDFEIDKFLTNYEFENYHPITSRQRILTDEGVRGGQNSWKHRFTMDAYEIQEFLGKRSSARNFAMGKDDFHADEDWKKHWLDEKESKILKSINKSQWELAKKYLEFRSIFTFDSELEFSNYCSILVSIILYCKSINIPLTMINWNIKTPIGSEKHKSWEDSFKDIVDDDDVWLLNDSQFTMRKYLTEKYGDDIIKMYVDMHHVSSEATYNFVNDILGPFIKNRLC